MRKLSNRDVFLPLLHQNSRLQKHVVTKKGISIKFPFQDCLLWITARGFILLPVSLAGEVDTFPKNSMHFVFFFFFYQTKDLGGRSICIETREQTQVCTACQCSRQSAAFGAATGAENTETWLLARHPPHFCFFPPHTEEEEHGSLRKKPPTLFR